MFGGQGFQRGQESARARCCSCASWQWWWCRAPAAPNAGAPERRLGGALGQLHCSDLDVRSFVQANCQLALAAGVELVQTLIELPVSEARLDRAPFLCAYVYAGPAGAGMLCSGLELCPAALRWLAEAGGHCACTVSRALLERMPAGPGPRLLLQAASQRPGEAAGGRGVRGRRPAARQGQRSGRRQRRVEGHADLHVRG